MRSQKNDRTVNVTYIEAPLEKVWWSIATPEGSDSYLTDRVYTTGSYQNPQVGDQYTLYYGDIINHSTIMACEPNRLFALSDSYKSMNPDGTIQTFELRTTFTTEQMEDGFVKLTIEVVGFRYDVTGQWVRECLEMGWRRSLMNLKSVLELGLDLRKEMFSYPRLGIANCTVNEFQTAATGVPVGQGNYLIEVHQNSPADLAGLRPGDVIVKIDGCPVPNYPAFVRAISRFYDQVRPVPITYLRDGITYETTADLSTDDRFTGLVDLTADSYENLKRKREYLASQRSASGQIWKKPTEDAGEPR